MTDKTPMEMFDELVRLGFVTPAGIEPSDLMEPTAYISVPTSLAFVTPPVPSPLPPPVSEENQKNAALGQRPKGNTKRKRRPK